MDTNTLYRNTNIRMSKAHAQYTRKHWKFCKYLLFQCFSYGTQENGIHCIAYSIAQFKYDNDK